MGNIGVLQILAPYLGDERYRGTQHDGQFARRREFFYDAERYASLSRSAGQDDSAASLSYRQSAALRAFLFPEYANAIGDSFVLHTSLRLNSLITAFTCLGVFALFVLEISLPLLV